MLFPPAFRPVLALIAGLALSIALPAQGADKVPVFVGFDGAYGVKHSTSAQSIELGLSAAIHEVNANGGVLGGRPLKLITKDNRSIAARGIANLEDFAKVDDMVAVFGGRFSPVILQQIETVHDKKMIMLDVWGAADGITDHSHSPSYTFRLSLKDSWAMPAMLAEAHAKGARKISVLLPNTGWGRSNQNALTKALADFPDMELVSALWYNWGETDMLRHYKQQIAAGTEAVLLVANDIEGSLLVRQLGDDDDTPRVPILSHWGVTGGNMVETSGPALAELDFTVVQTFSFFKARPGPLETFSATVREIAGVNNVMTLDAPVGVGHAYDMMHILAKAIDMAGSTEPPAVRDALERVDRHEGLVRVYDPPFTPSDHDALSADDVFLAKYRGDGVLEPLRR